MNSLVKSYALVILAYVIWGLGPIYWTLFSDTPPLVVLLHRVFWSMALLGVYLVVSGKLGLVVSQLFKSESRNRLLLSSACLATNWLTYIWAISAREYVASSIGYFICPIFTIALGAIVCRERLTVGQQISVALLLIGIAVPVIIYGTLPLIALVLAGSWSAYTLFRKQNSIGALEGVFLETLLVLPVVALITYFSEDLTVIMDYGNTLNELILFATTGIITILPQILLLSGVKHIPLKVIGIALYVAPTIMMLLSVVYFKVTLDTSDLLSITIIWAGILLFFSADYLFSLFKRTFAKFSISPSVKILRE